MATIGLQHSLDPGPEGLAGLDNEVHGHLVPLLLNGGLQSIHTGMGMLQAFSPRRPKCHSQVD
ncbi:Uncharacterized protein FKW44_016023 [Caligus rogercresseyi]|uniref:Uncharacterized protein n=1 Tax=Caligus rogercresseyi TaxID=217165 RepID=A0A7T8H1G1_CALRO|nr:Uncharacterized protein FKW44_016023 [Caligus rogercresseyi]